MDNKLRNYLATNEAAATDGTRAYSAEPLKAEDMQVALGSNGAAWIDFLLQLRFNLKDMPGAKNDEVSVARLTVGRALNEFERLCGPNPKRSQPWKILWLKNAERLKALGEGNEQGLVAGGAVDSMMKAAKFYDWVDEDLKPRVWTMLPGRGLKSVAGLQFVWTFPEEKRVQALGALEDVTDKLVDSYKNAKSIRAYVVEAVYGDKIQDFLGERLMFLGLEKLQRPNQIDAESKRLGRILGYESPTLKQIISKKIGELETDPSLREAAIKRHIASSKKQTEEDGTAVAKAFLSLPVDERQRIAKEIAAGLGAFYDRSKA
ncbi:hypothetical protein [Ruegeria arenilitoris]|uniref:hypothetical protein n=1 Tax=Ruegeria arenilitoris TaxID=1173585 RepID=UPI00147F1264|nr:hypothetical protein [Ruegeria arenilitoris]